MHRPSSVSHELRMGAFQTPFTKVSYKTRLCTVRFNEFVRPSTGVRGLAIGLAVSTVIWSMMAIAAYAMAT